MSPFIFYTLFNSGSSMSSSSLSSAPTSRSFLQKVNVSDAAATAVVVVGGAAAAAAVVGAASASAVATQLFPKNSGKISKLLNCFPLFVSTFY